VPPKMAAPAYPLTERHGLVWIWMGDPARAKPETIPDLAYLRDETRFRTVRNYFNLPYGTALMFDNLMDLSHADFLHKGLISEGMGEKTRATMTTTDEGDCVRVRWILREALPSPADTPSFTATLSCAAHSNWLLNSRAVTRIASSRTWPSKPVSGLRRKRLSPPLNSESFGL